MSGFGKTAPVLAGSILAAEEDDNRIIYACRTKRQVFRVMEEIERIQRKIPLRTTYLFAKNDYCLLKETSRFPVSQESFKWYCSFNVTNNLCSYFLNISLLNKEVDSLVREFSSSVRSHSKLARDVQEHARLPIRGGSSGDSQLKDPGHDLPLSLRRRVQDRSCSTARVGPLRRP